jgi:hypothetical protein
MLGCADREEIRARQMAKEASADADNDANCRAKAAPGSADNGSCRQDLADRQARQAEIEYQKRRYFDRVLGAGTSGTDDPY